jgi:predicted extracellular nuclease
MPTLLTSLRVRATFLAFFLVLFMGGHAAFAAGASTLAISQVFGGGGNSGAQLNSDYIEIVNPTAFSVSLSGYSLQYASSTGTSYQTFSLPSFTLQPGQYYLVMGATGTAGSALPITADATTTINLSGTTGKVALVNSTTALSGTGGCPTGAPTVDYVGYGSGATCFTGAGPTATLSSILAAIRSNPCVAPTNNATDFTASTPAPHNSSSTFLNCSLGSSLSGSGVATPATVYTGSTSLLTVQVVPASLPTSTGIQVSANLSGISGSTAQKLYDDGTNGDVTAGDNIFSYSVTPTTSGTFSFPVTVTDAQLRMASASIALTVSTPPPFVSIRTIQATKPSTYATKTVTTSGIVIGVKSSGFYIEAADADITPVTPEGILVYTGSTKLPSYIAVGALVQVTGVVNTYPTTGLTPGTEIDAPQTFSLVSASNALPTPVKITAAMDSPTGGLMQFSKYEGMRVAIDSLTTTSGTDASLTETTETQVSNGLFYGVVTGVARPFREPGIAINDTTFGAIPAGIPVWDSNPELLYIDSLSTGGPTIDLTSNATVTGIVGVMDFSFGQPEIVLDSATRPTVSGLMSATAVPARASTDFNVATFNMERFYNDVADADNPGSSVVVVTTAAYQRRLAKASMAIRNVLLSPDLVGVQELENLAVLTDLANKISADAIAAGQADPVYKPYLFLATDGTGINTGVLVKSTRVDVVKVEQFGLSTTFTNSTGAQAVLNDRTPLVLHAGIKRTTGADYPVTFIVVHQRSLISVDDPTSTGATVRLKREAQAEYLANLIQGYQASGEHVITVGDYNGFEFSDGFVDVLGVTKGNPVPASQVVTPPLAGIVNPVLTDLVTLLPAAQRQSYVENGSAQVLDHVVVTSDLVPLETGLVYAHIDSDYPLVYENDATRPERVSDHDPAVAYFTVPPAPVPVVTLSSTAVGFGAVAVGSTATQTVKLTNSGTGALTFSSITATGTGYAQTNDCSTGLAAGSFCTITATFTPGSSAALTGSVAIVSNAASSPDAIGLSGTGVAPIVTLSGTAVTFGPQLVGIPATKTVTLTNSGTAALSVTSIAVTGAGYAQTNNCGSSVAVNGSCVITVTFTPGSSVALTGSVSIASNAASSPNAISLSGTGVAPIVTLSAPAVAFGSQLVGTPSTKTVTLTNSGTAALSVTSIAASGAGYAQTNTCGTSVAVNGSCVITVTFTPGSSAALTGSVSIVSSAASSPDAIGLTGTGVAPIVTLSPTTLAFGSQLVGTSATKTVTLTNSGTTVLTITSVAASGAGYAQTNTCGTSVAVNGSCVITVTFLPATSATVTGSVSVASNAGASATVLSLSGTGIAPIVSLSATTLAFGTQLITTSATKAVTLTNTGSATLTFTTFATTGVAYYQTNTCGSSLSAGQSCIINAGFTPGSAGALTGAISIVSNAASSPDTIALTGTGGDFSLSAVSPTATVVDGNTATLQFMANSISGYTGTISLSCSGATNGETCSVNPSAVTLASAAQSFSVMVTTTSQYLAERSSPGESSPRGHGHGLYEGLGGVAMAALVGCFGRRRLRVARGVVFLALGCVSLAMIAGCETGYNQLSPNRTQLGAQTVTVTATANGISRSATVTLTVQ